MSSKIPESKHLSISTYAEYSTTTTIYLLWDTATATVFAINPAKLLLELSRNERTVTHISQLWPRVIFRWLGHVSLPNPFKEVVAHRKVVSLYYFTKPAARIFNFARGLIEENIIKVVVSIVFHLNVEIDKRNSKETKQYCQRSMNIWICNI